MNKEDVLKIVNPAQIYAHFLNLNEFPRGNISSPFCEDKNPSFKLFKNGTFKCFSSGKQGDVFQFVADLNNMDCKRDFHKVLQLIAREMKINYDEHPPLPSPGTAVVGADSSHFVVVEQPFSRNHIEFWFKFLQRHDVEPFLKRYKVKALKHLEYFSHKNNAVQKYTVYKGVLSFYYEVNGRYEIYTPEQPEKKVKKFFYSGLKNEDVYGLEQLPPEKLDELFICAGKKDCLCLNARNFNAVTFRSEAIFPTPEQMETLRLKAEKLFICYDNDFANPSNPGRTNPGRTQMVKICEKYTYLTPVFLPENINDIADFFSLKTIADFRKLIDESAEDETAKENQHENTIFHIVEKYLSANYDLRFNTVKLDVEISGKRINNWKSLNENNLYVELQKKNMNVSMERLLSILKSDFVPQHNPFLHYFKNLPPYRESEPDHIKKLTSYIHAIEPELFEYHFKKWLVRAVKCALVPDYFNKQAFIIVQSEQNSGKSTFCRYLCPPALSEYIAEDISNDKDARILLCKNFLINLDELAVLSRQEINSLKSYFSKTQINERLPYERKNSIINRTCSFTGSTNMDEFLNDETGSVRWLCFRIHAINWNYSKEVDINRVWAQAYRLAGDKDFDPELSAEDIKNNEERNREFTILTKEKSLIHKYFLPADFYDDAEYMTATDIELFLRQKVGDMRLNIVSIGKAAKSLGHVRIKHNGIYCYAMKPKTENT